MAHTFPTTGIHLKTHWLTNVISKLNSHDIAEKSYTVFACSSALLLIGLGLRVVLALLFVGGPFAHALTIVTDPFVTPFDLIFKDSHTMIQMSTGAAFTAYYLFYSMISLSSHFVRHSEPEAEPEMLGQLAKF